MSDPSRTGTDDIISLVISAQHELPDATWAMVGDSYRDSRHKEALVALGAAVARVRAIHTEIIERIERLQRGEPSQGNDEVDVLGVPCLAKL